MHLVKQWKPSVMVIVVAQQKAQKTQKEKGAELYQ